MNEWQCDELGCREKVHGVGSAIGLRAIGWWFMPGAMGLRGPHILCPAHRPDGIPCEDKYAAQDVEEALAEGREIAHPEYLQCCPFCAAEREAKLWQEAMGLREMREAL